MKHISLLKDIFKLIDPSSGRNTGFIKNLSPALRSSVLKTISKTENEYENLNEVEELRKSVLAEEEANWLEEEKLQIDTKIESIYEDFWSNEADTFLNEVEEFNFMRTDFSSDGALLESNFRY